MISLEEIKAREQTATRGPWKSEPMTSKKARRGNQFYYKISCAGNNICHYLTAKDADFISSARTDIPALLAEVERLQSELHEEKSRRYQAECNYDHTVKDRDTLKNALELACNDAADGCCPYEIYSFDCRKVGVCPNQVKGREDSGIDKRCWYDYYIQQAQEQENPK